MAMSIVAVHPADDLSGIDSTGVRANAEALVSNYS
jgi:hypothetical protein